jgi:hypothetical protein
MQDATGGSQDPPAAGYSLQEAATLLGIGVNTLRRRIAAGQVRAAQVERPQGYVWRVYLDSRHPPIDPTAQPPNQEATGSLPHAPTPIAQADAMVSLIQTTIGTVLGPLVGELAASRQGNERQAEQLAGYAATIAELREDRGRLTAELAGAQAEIQALTSSAASGSAQPASRLPGTFLRAWARLDWLVVALVVAVLVAGLLLAVRR